MMERILEVLNELKQRLIILQRKVEAIEKSLDQKGENNG